MSFITVATFNEPSQAESLRRRLVEAGILVQINDERRVQRFWFMSEPLAGIRLQVPKGEFERARHLLADWDRAGGILRDAICCPKCHSSRVEYPQMTRKFITPTLVELFFFLKVLEREFYCQDCQYTWPKVEVPDIDRDILNWPAQSRLWHAPEKKDKAAA